jgi:hypothetical protein
MRTSGNSAVLAAAGRQTDRTAMTAAMQCFMMRPAWFGSDVAND